MRSEDRYLRQRGGRYHYVRRVPADLRQHYNDVLIRRSLKTDDLAIARLRRDEFERADDAYWSTVRLEGKSTSAEQRRYDAVVKRAVALNFDYVRATDLASPERLESLLERIEQLERGGRPSRGDVDALMGRVDRPDVHLQGAFDLVCNEVKAEYLANKDEEGRRDWIRQRQSTIDHFNGLYGSPTLDQIDRSMARKYYNHWNDRVLGRSAGERITGNHANRQIGNLRGLIGEYWKHLGEDRANPFAGFSFSNKRKGRREAFSVEQIQRIFLVPGLFEKMNREARLIVYLMVETGARLSEIATLEASDFRLEGDIPHVLIYERDGRSLKTANSNRIMPLVGIALEAARISFKDGGFPHYRVRRKSLSTAINKFCRENGLFEPDQSIYSLRHSFENRLKEARVDVEMRKYLMGHEIDREEYGSYGSLQLKYAAAKAIELPYDARVLADIC